MIRSKIKFLILFIVLVMFASFIYMQSNTPYKDQDMKPMLKEYLKLSVDSFPKASFSYDGEKVTTEKPYAFIEFILRKLGHILEYLVLTLIIYVLITQVVFPTKWATLFCFMLSLAYAVTDEWHQTYVPGRTGHLIDVFTFDLFGIVLALIIIGVVRFAKRSKSIAI